MNSKLPEEVETSISEAPLLLANAIMITVDSKESYDFAANELKKIAKKKKRI